MLRSAQGRGVMQCLRAVEVFGRMGWPSFGFGRIRLPVKAVLRLRLESSMAVSTGIAPLLKASMLQSPPSPNILRGKP